MDVLLEHHASLIRRLRKSHTDVSVTEVNEMLDECVKFLNTAENQTDGLHVLTIICHQLASIHVLQLFDNETIMRHEFFIFIQRTLEMLLTKATFLTMTKDDEQCWYEISDLIVHLCLFKNHPLRSSDEDSISQISYQKIFLTKPFLNKFARMIISDLAINDYEPYHIKYKVLNHLLYLCTEVMNIDHQLLFDSIVQCLCSHLHLDVYDTIDFQQSMINPKQYFFLYQCPQFIRRYSDQRQTVQISNSLYESLLENSIKIFDRHLSSISLEGESVNNRGKMQPISWHMELLNHLALTPDTRRYFGQDTCRIIIDQLINILRSESLIKRIENNQELHHADITLMSSTITLLYNLVFEEEIFIRLKNNDVSRFCVKLHQSKDRRIQFASQMLSAVLNQEDIDHINDPTIIAENCLFYLENSIDKSSQIYNGIKLENILANLQIIIQNDRIKEIVGNDHHSLSLLARCVLDQSVNRKTIQCLALRILEALSFGNKKICKKMNEKLMDLIKHLSDTDDLILNSIANRIRWKIKDEKNFILKQIATQREISINSFDDNQTSSQPIQQNFHWDLFDNKTTNTVNLMISCHHSDIEMCTHIYHYLNTLNFHHVLFGTGHVHETLPEVMAETIEKSSIVLICFSNHYQQSYSCRLEAEYAQKRKRTIIPVKLDEFYCPTGWLKNMLADKSCIEVTASDFNSACANLLQQINDLKEKSI